LFILQAPSQNNKRTTDKEQFVADDAGGKSLPWQGQRFMKRARTKEAALKIPFSLAATSCCSRTSFQMCIQKFFRFSLPLLSESLCSWQKRILFTIDPFILIVVKIYVDVSWQIC